MPPERCHDGAAMNSSIHVRGTRLEGCAPVSNAPTAGGPGPSGVRCGADRCSVAAPLRCMIAQKEVPRAHARTAPASTAWGVTPPRSQPAAHACLFDWVICIQLYFESPILPVLGRWWLVGVLLRG